MLRNALNLTYATCARIAFPTAMGKGKSQFNANGCGPSKKLATQRTLDLEVNRMVWVDLEMTGLDLEKDRILEVACIVTDSELNIVAEGPSIVVHQSEEVLRGMNEWCVKQHGKTGLTEASLKSSISEYDAEDCLLKFLKKHVSEKMSPLAGNSVYMDRLFLKRFMPRFEDYLHYRIVDVSTVKELCRRWSPDVYRRAPAKAVDHRALGDIRESVEELKFYKAEFFKS